MADVLRGAVPVVRPGPRRHWGRALPAFGAWIGHVASLSATVPGMRAPLRMLAVTGCVALAAPASAALAAAPAHPAPAHVAAAAPRAMVMHFIVDDYAA